MSELRARFVLATLLVWPAGAWAELPSDRSPEPLPPGAVARLGSHRFRHGQPVAYVTFAPDGRRLVSQATDGSFHVWETASGKELHRFRGIGADPHQREFMVMAGFRGHWGGEAMSGGAPAVFAAEGTALLLVHADRSLRFHDLRTGQETRRLAPPVRSLRGLIPSADGKTVAVIGAELSVRLCDTLTGRTITHVAEPPLEAKRDEPFFAEITTAAFSPDGRVVAVGGHGETGKGLVRLYDAATGQELPFRAQPDQRVFGLLFAPGGRLLLVKSQDAVLALWDVAQGKELRRLEQQAGAGMAVAAFSPDGKTLAVAQGNDIRLEEALTGKELRKLEGHKALVLALAYSADGRLLATGGLDHTVRLWDLAAGKEASAAGAGPQGSVLTAVCSPDGRRLATVGIDYRVCVWDVAAAKLLHHFDRPGNNNEQSGDGREARPVAAFGPGGASLIVAWPDGRLGVWDLAGGKAPAGGRPDSEWGGTAHCLALSADGKLLATGESDGVIRVRDAATGKERFPISAFAQPQDEDGNPRGGESIHFVTFTPDGRLLIAKGVEVQRGARRADDQARVVVRIWETATGKERRPLRLRPDAAEDRAQDLERLLLGQTGGIHLRRPHFADGLEARVVGAQLAPGGRLLAVSLGQEILLWDQVEGRELRRVGAHQDVTEYAFSPDGKLLAAGQSDGALNVWDVATGSHLVRSTGHRGKITAVAFTPDGRRLFTAGRDTTVLLWELTALLRAGRSPPAGADGTPEQLWADLAADDATRADRAAWALVADPARAVPFLAKCLRPAPAVDRLHIQRLVAELGSTQFKAREAAFAELEKLGPLAEPALRLAQEGQPSEEMGQRIGKLLDKLRGPVTLPDRVRELRAVEVLERIGTAAARQVLEGLAQGGAEAPLTGEARAALERLARQSDARP